MDIYTPFQNAHSRCNSLIRLNKIDRQIVIQVAASFRAASGMAAIRLSPEVLGEYVLEDSRFGVS